MNSGLTNLSTLKTELLPAEMQLETRWNDALTALGLGVASLFESHCGRVFGYSAAAVEKFPADRAHLALTRYPIGAVTSVEILYAGEETWSACADEPLTVRHDSGLVHLSTYLGSSRDQVRVTFSGGYWWEQLEPDDAAYPSTMPAAATALPADLKLAFLLQCRKTWESIDKIGDKILKVGSGATFVTESLGGLALVPMVSGILNRYARLSGL